MVSSFPPVPPASGVTLRQSAVSGETPSLTAGLPCKVRGFRGKREEQNICMSTVTSAIYNILFIPINKCLALAFLLK